MTILYTGGTFDLFHSGHVNFLKRCKEIATTVVVSLNTDSFIKEYKGESPVISYKDRVTILESCRYVDNVVENTYGADSKPAILKVKPNIIAVGSDWENKDYYKQMSFTKSWLYVNNIQLSYIPYTVGISSTKIKGLLDGRS